MKRTIIKSFILIAAIIVAVSGVLFFILTVVSPPNDIEKKNVHQIDIENCISAYNPDSLSLGQAENKMDLLHDRAALFLSDSLITENVFDNAIKKSTNSFAQSFIKWSHSKFNQMTWNVKDHSEMRRIMSKVRNISVENGSKKALESQELSSLTEIETILSDYNAAWNITRRTTYSSLDDASRIISEAKNYASHNYLKNCSELVNALNKVSTKIEESHLNQLRRQVSSLANYRSMEKADYVNKSQDVQSKIREYDNNANRVYGIKHDVSELRKRAGEYYNEAMEYYKRMEVITKYNPSCNTTSTNRGCRITQVQLNQNYTRVTFNYNNSYSQAGWVTISPRTYIVDQQGNRHYMIRAEGIPTEPQKHYFNSANESLTFTLVFDRLPVGTTSFSLIESDSSSWKFYNININ